MIIIFEFPSRKSHPGRYKKCKLRRTEKHERSHVKVKKIVIRCKGKQSQNVVPYETVPEINLLQARVPSQGHRNAFSAAWLLGSRDQRDLTCVPNCFIES